MTKDMLVLSAGGEPPTILSLDQGTLRVTVRRRVRGIGAVVLSMILPLLALLPIGGLFVIGVGFIELLEGNWLALLVIPVFALGTAISGAAFLYFMGNLFTAKAALSENRYSYRNGLLRFSVKLTGVTEIELFPSYSRGDWGHGAQIRRQRRRIPLPFMPMSVLGSKRQAYDEAKCVRDWLEEHNFKVSMKSWGQKTIEEGKIT